MILRSHVSGRRPRATFLVALLLLTLGLAGVLAYQAQDAARSHRAAAEAALRDYAGFATWEYSRRVQSGVAMAVHQTLHPLFEPGSHTVPRATLPGLAEFEALSDPSSDACGVVDHIAAYFRLDPRSGRLTTNGGRVPPAVEVWIAETVEAELEAARPQSRASSREAAIFGRVEGESWAIGYAVSGGPGAESVHGFVAPGAALAAACAGIFPDAPLLPPSLTGGAPNDSLLSVLVTTPAGDVLCGSSVQYASGFVATDTLASGLGGLVVQVMLRPEAAGSLLIGGLPASRMPLLIGLLLLTAGLIIAVLIQLRREYELARLREEFVSGVSHELRTPLAQIRMFVETLLLGRVRSDAERDRSLEIIDREARRLGHLVDNVLRFSRSTRGVGRITREPTALAPLIREVVEAFAPLARARGIRVRTVVEPGVAAVVDRGAVRQMLLNLLDNAVKYGPAGQTVTVGLESSGRGVELRVDDEGPGVPHADRARIWSAFTRLQRDVDAAVAGSGIGLAVVAELAGLHGGRARVEAAPGGGARFVVELPDAWRRLDEAAATAGVGRSEGVA